MDNLDLDLDFLSKKYYLDINIHIGCHKYIHSGCHNYVPGYTSIFKDIRYDVKNLLAIGIGSIENGQVDGVVHPNYKTGNNLKCWSEYFPSSKIYGIDIFQDNELNTDKINTFVVDPSNENELQNFMDTIDCSLNIIIDDNNHTAEHQVNCFTFLNKYLSENGIYVIQDIQPENINKFMDLSIFPLNYIEYIKENFNVIYFDTRKDYNRDDDFMVVFKKI